MGPDLKGNTFGFSLLNKMLAVGFPCTTSVSLRFIIIRNVELIELFFYIYGDGHVIFKPLFYLYIIFINFHLLDDSCIAGINPT